MVTSVVLVPHMSLARNSLYLAGRGQVIVMENHLITPPAGERPKLLVDRRGSRNAAVDPEAVAKLERLAGLDRVRGGEVEGGAHPAVVANVKHGRMVGVLRMIEQGDAFPP